MTTFSDWTPGQEVEVIANRLKIRTLRPSDIVGNDAPPWYGNAERRTHVWAPPVPPGVFLRGLAASCDQKNFFSFLATKKEDGTAVGMSKGAVEIADNEKVFVLTTLVGDLKNEGLMLGYEITSATLWFATTQLDITSISTRMYDSNVKTIEMMKHFGYALHSTTEEQTPSGVRLVHDYRKTRDKWLSDYTARFSNWKIQVPTD